MNNNSNGLIDYHSPHASTSLSPSKNLKDRPPSISPPGMQLPRGGYECKFVNPPPALIQSECTVCFLIFRHPHLVSCCGHNYCKDCISHFIDNNLPCPLCKNESFTILRNQALERSLAQLEVWCSHHKLGCQWEGELGKYSEHLNVNPEEKGLLVGCMYVELQCPYKCGHQVCRGEMAKHQDSECAQRPVCCVYCKEYSSTHEDVVNSHWSVCPSYPVSCPNHCLADTMERQKLEGHLEYDCPLKLTECQFHSAGCKEVVTREKLSDHLEKCPVRHTIILAEANEKIVNEKIVNEKIVNEKIVNELECNSGQETQNRSGEMEFENVMDDTQRQMDNLWVENALLKQKVSQIQADMDELREEMTSFYNIYNKIKSEREGDQRTCHKLEQELSEVRSELELSRVSLSQQCYSVQASIGVFPVEFVMTDFSQRQEVKEVWRSGSFYSHLQGYRLCLVIYPSEAQDAHLSVHASLVQGEFDDKLKWPFRGEITVQLRNVLMDKHHATGVIKFTELTPSQFTSRVDCPGEGQKSEREGWGLKRFILRSELSYNAVKNKQYLKDNKLFFRVLKVRI